MPRERSGIDYAVLADAKKGPRRDPNDGWETPGSSLKTYTHLAKVNEARIAAARDEAFGRQAEGCRRLPCFRCARPDASAAHHEPPRSRGGTDKDTIPLCDLTRLGGVPGCHQLRHDQGEETFWKELRFTPDEAKEHVRLQIAKLPAETP